jgi:hypothetical protein
LTPTEVGKQGVRDGIGCTAMVCCSEARHRVDLFPRPQQHPGKNKTKQRTRESQVSSGGRLACVAGRCAGAKPGSTRLQEWQRRAGGLAGARRRRGKIFAGAAPMHRMHLMAALAAWARKEAKARNPGGRVSSRRKGERGGQTAEKTAVLGSGRALFPPVRAAPEVMRRRRETPGLVCCRVDSGAQPAAFVC